MAEWKPKWKHLELTEDEWKEWIRRGNAARRGWARRYMAEYRQRVLAHIVHTSD